MRPLLLLHFIANGNVRALPVFSEPRIPANYVNILCCNNHSVDNNNSRAAESLLLVNLDKICNKLILLRLFGKHVCE